MWGAFRTAVWPKEGLWGRGWGSEATSPVPILWRVLFLTAAQDRPRLQGRLGKKGEFEGQVLPLMHGGEAACRWRWQRRQLAEGF